MCQPKKDGGMNFKDFNHMNSSLLIKQTWRLHHSLDEFWARMLRSIYFENGSIKSQGRWAVTSGSSLPIKENN